MNIVTAKEARNISNNSFPKEIVPILSFIMPKIVETAEQGKNEIILYKDDCPEGTFSQMLTKLFTTTMEKYGYKVKIKMIEYCSEFFQTVTIYW